MTRRRAQASASAATDANALKIVVPDGLTPAERQRETAEYLADMILELRNLARGAKLHMVMVPLEYAYYEAFGAAHRVDVPEAEIERIKRLTRASEDAERRPG
jgi:hypothetical protein